MEDEVDREISAVALALVGERLGQLRLEPNQRDLSVFSHYFVDGSDEGIRASFTIDLVESRVLEVLRHDVDANVFSVAGDDAVVDVRMNDRFVWRTPRESGPFTLAYTQTWRFLLRRLGGSWLIVDVGGLRDMWLRHGTPPS